MAQPADESDVDRPPVKLAVEIEQEHFQQRRGRLKHRPQAETRHAVVALAVDAGTHRIDAMLEPAGRIEPDIGGGEAKLAPALVAVDHLAGHEPRRAEQLRRFHHLALVERRAHRARRHRPALILERRHDVDGKAEPPALLLQILRRAGAVLAEMEIEANGRAADAETAHENLLDEFFRRGRHQRRVEGHDDGAIESGACKQAQLVALARKLEQRVLRPQELSRVRREGERRSLAVELSRSCARGVDHGAVAAVHAVEIADGDDGPVQRSIVATAHNREGVDRCVRNHSSAGGELKRKKDLTAACPILRHACRFSAGYGYSFVNKVSN